MVILGLVDCMLKDGEPFDVKLTMYQGIMVYGYGVWQHCYYIIAGLSIGTVYLNLQVYLNCHRVDVRYTCCIRALHL